MRRMHPEFLERLPRHIRNKVFLVLESQENPMESFELRNICENYGIPFDFVFREIQQFDLFEGDDDKASEAVREAIKEIEKTSI